MVKSSEVFALYRSYVRKARCLPHVYLRTFFRVKAADDFRKILGTKSPTMLKRKLRRVTKDMKMIQDANEGRVQAFTKVLDIAYGRTGKLKYELMEPILSRELPLTTILSSRAKSGARAAEPKSRLPTYSEELKALLTSASSRTTKPMDAKSLTWPQKLPPRADPNSEEARLLGPFSRRRFYNIHWRQFKSEWQRVRPPLQVPHEKGVHHRPNSLGLVEEIESLVGPVWSPRAVTRKQDRSVMNADGLACQKSPKPKRNHSRLPQRWLRRRYQQLLGRVPVLTPDEEGQKYTVSLSPASIASALKYGANRWAQADSTDLAWFNQAIPEKRTQRRREDSDQHEK